MPRKRSKASSQASMQPENAIGDLLAEADKHIDEFEFDVALGFCERALRMDENNVRALETCSSVLLEVGKLKKAKECLAKAVNISPELGHGKYFSLAQLSEGKTAVSFYNKGIELAKKELEFAQGAAESSINAENLTTVDSKTCANLRRKISNAFCSIVEIFMTDLCDEEDAEEQCALNIEQAILTDETNPESYQCKASFVMVRENVEEARQLMLKSLSLWLPKIQQIDESNTTEECQLSFEARLNSSKLLIELKEFETAAEVLINLQVEDDECIEVYYLQGLSNYLREGGDEESKKEAKFYFQAALNLFQKFGMSEDEIDMHNHVLELLEELKDVILDDDDAEGEENKENENDSEFSSSENDDEEMET